MTARSLLFACLAIACTLSIEAQTPRNAQLSWTNATLNTDNSPIPATGSLSLARTTVEYGTCAGAAFGTKQGEVFVAAPGTTLNVSMVVVQQYCFRAFHTNVAGTLSAFSSVVVLVNPAPIPAAPGGLTVTLGALTAYNIIKTNDAFVAIPVGTVPAGTRCDASQNILGYNVVPAASVQWSATVDIRPVVVVARCG